MISCISDNVRPVSLQKGVYFRLKGNAIGFAIFTMVWPRGGMPKCRVLFVAAKLSLSIHRGLVFAILTALRPLRRIPKTRDRFATAKLSLDIDDIDHALGFAILTALWLFGRIPKTRLFSAAAKLFLDIDDIDHATKCKFLLKMCTPPYQNARLLAKVIGTSN